MVIKRSRLLPRMKLEIKLMNRFAMLVTHSRLEERNGEHHASGYAKALSSIAADDKRTQILTAADGFELDGDGKERHGYLIERIDGIPKTTASQGTIEQNVAPI